MLSSRFVRQRGSATHKNFRRILRAHRSENDHVATGFAARNRPPGHSSLLDYHVQLRAIAGAYTGLAARNRKITCKLWARRRSSLVIAIRTIQLTGLELSTRRMSRAQPHKTIGDSSTTQGLGEGSTQKSALLLSESGLLPSWILWTSTRTYRDSIALRCVATHAGFRLASYTPVSSLIFHA